MTTIETTGNPKLSLAGLRVGISGAIPEREHWGSAVDLDRLILSFVSRLSGFVMEYGGTIVHGSHPAITPVIAEQARDERQVELFTVTDDEGNLQSRPGHPDSESGAIARPNPLTLVASQLWGEFPEITERAVRQAGGAEVVLTPRLGPGDIKDSGTRNASLTGMRVVMAGQVDVQVAIGGKLHRDTGLNPGVLEELAIMRWNGIPCFVVAGCGGMAGKLESTMLHRFSDGNMLAPDEVDKMAMWSGSVDEYVGTLLTHLARHRDVFLSGSEASPARRIHLRPVPPMPGATQTRIADIDPQLVDQTSRRFAQVKEAVDKADDARVGELLKTPPGSRSSPGAISSA